MLGIILTQLKRGIAITAVLLIGLTCQAQIDFVGNMFPNGGSTSTAVNDPITVYVQVFKNGVTEPAGRGAGIDCEIYYGEVVTFGGVWSNTSQIAMSYNVDIGNNDEYFADLVVGSGKIEFTCRCTDDGGTNFTWVDLSVLGNAKLLPVVLSKWNVTALDYYALLQWTTSSEINSSHFDIQRSRDGMGWQTIGKVQSVGNSRIDNEYQFVDKGAPTGNVYYRLQQVDIDGVIDYSDILSVNIRLKNNEINIYPNPTKGLLNIEIENNTLNASTVSIYNINGKLVYYQVIDDNKNTIDVNNFSNGIYQVIVRNTSDEQLLTQRIVKN